MRYPASLVVLILAVVAVVVGVFMGRNADPTLSVAAAGDVVAAAPVADDAEVAVVATGGAGSTPTESVDASQQEWVRVPGTGVAIWPKPRTKAD